MRHRRSKRMPRPELRPRSEGKRKFLRWILLLLGGWAAAADAPRPLPVVDGQVTRVSDGDSIEVDTDRGHERVRFSAIDTPEYDQPYGPQSSAALKAMLPVGSQVEL